MSRSDPQVNFRLPADLRDQLQASAVASGRTLTAEIIARLQGSFEALPRGANASLDAKLEDVQKGIRRLEKMLDQTAGEAKRTVQRAAK